MLWRRARTRLGFKRFKTEQPEEQSYLFGLLTEQIENIHNKKKTCSNMFFQHIPMINSTKMKMLKSSIPIIHLTVAMIDLSFFFTLMSNFAMSGTLMTVNSAPTAPNAIESSS